MCDDTRRRKRWRTVLTCILLLAFGTSTAEQTVFQVLTGFPDNAKPQKALVRGAKKITKGLNGRVKLRFVAANEKSGEKLLERFLADSQLSAVLLPSVVLLRLMPNADLYGQLFLFQDNNEVKAVRAQMDNDLLASLRSDDLVTIGIWGLGFFHIMGRDFDKGFDGLAGQTVWMPIETERTVSALAELSMTAISGNPDQLNNEKADMPALIIHNVTALILDKRIPRSKVLLQPPLQYGYFLLVAKRSSWEDLGVAESTAIKQQLADQFRQLERKADSAAVRSLRLLKRRGMDSVTVSAEDVERLRSVDNNDEIAVALQNQLLNTIEAHRRERASMESSTDNQAERTLQ